jgi:hypothetical protein
LNYTQEFEEWEKWAMPIAAPHLVEYATQCENIRRLSCWRTRTDRHIFESVGDQPQHLKNKCLWRKKNNYFNLTRISKSRLWNK